MRRSGPALAVVLCLTALAGCGGTGPSGPSRPADREWAANADGVIGILERDLALSASGGATLAAARRALADSSNLYTILVAYTDFGGCTHMVGSIGPPLPRFAKVTATLGGVCGSLERASALFTHATQASDPRSLLAATRLALATAPRLARARAELDAAHTG